MRRLLMVCFAACLLIGCATSSFFEEPKVDIALSIRKSNITLSYIVEIAPRVLSLAISSDGINVASGLSDNTIMLWNVSLGKGIGVLKGHKGIITSLAFSTDGKKLVSGDNNGVIKIWDMSSGKEIRTIITNSESVALVAFSKDEKFILSGCREAVQPSVQLRITSDLGKGQSIKVWDATSGRQVKHIKTGTCKGLWQDITAFAFSQDGVYALTVDENNKGIILWDIATGKAIRQFKGHFGETTALAFAPDAKFALSGSADGSIKLWEISSGNEIRTLKGHSDLVRSVAFFQNGYYAVSGSYDEIAKIWEISTGRETGIFKGHSSKINTVVVSNDSKIIVTGSNDRTVRIWNTTSKRDILKMAKLIKYESSLPQLNNSNAGGLNYVMNEYFSNAFKDKWVVITGDGFYACSTEIHNVLEVKKGFMQYQIGQFYDVFYRPDIITARLHGEDTSNLVTLSMDDALKNPPPDVDISSVPSKTEKQKIPVTFTVKSNGGGIGEVRIFHNGKLVKSDGFYRTLAKLSDEKLSIAAVDGKAIYRSLRSVSIKEKNLGSTIISETKGDKYRGEVEIEAVPGDNEISITAFNKDNTVQSKLETVTFKSTLPPADPHLYILAIGIDDYRDKKINLTYAAKDAKDVSRKLVEESSGIYKQENIHTITLTDNEASKKNISAKIDELTKKIRSVDGLVIFVAGHGVLHLNQYYLVTHDYNGIMKEDSMISSNEIMEMSKRIKSLNQLLIFDTCHAGGVDWIVSGLYDARMSSLAKQMGLHIYASASSMQEAKDGYKGNGLFTHTLLNGLDNNKKADLNKDKMVSVKELGEYSRQETTDITRQSGHVQAPMIINFGNDYPVYKLH